MIYFLNGNQEVIKIVRSSAVISAIQTQELPEDNSLLRDYLSVRLKNDERLFNAQYMAIKSYGGNRNAFDLYRIASEIVPDNATEFMGVQVAPYELEGVAIEDLRPQNRPLNQTMSQVLEGSDWRLGYVADNLPNVTTNFYYVSVKDALKKIQELTNVEMLFKVEISGNKITDKWVEVYHQLGNRTMKRFNYGTNALSVVRESSHDELYTALIGRGKGEEVGETESGDATYGRKINFADVEWEKSAGKPVDKPKGQKYIELPNATAEYGIKLIDGRKVPRIGIVDFSEADDPEKLIQQTYQELLVRARPKVLFKASVINTGDMLIGDTVTIHRHDLDFHYQARVRRVVRDRKNNNQTQVEIGDVVHTPSTKRQGQINNALNNVASDFENVRGEVTEARQSADGKNTNFYGNVEPNRKKVGDTWFRDHPSLTGESQILVWNGEAWELIMDTSDTTKNADDIAEQQQEIELAQQTADEAVDEINTAITNAGFTSLDDTLQNMNYITMNAEQSAQQAITNASNAYGLAQTSISEAQTAQENSLTALGKADNALDGVSSLNIRVDDVEAELELKADNTFMNEDGTLTTLSNAITFNAHRFSSDMSRIESRVESLAGEINLVILKDAFEDRRIEANTVYPNVSFVDTGHNTMRELITVTGGEKIALSKEATTPITNDTNWRVIYYDSQMGIISRPMTASNEIVLTVPNNATKMWVSWPKGSKPQIIRGSDFLPYRPNMADQMTTDEMVIFRNEYDEYADRTERRLSAIDSTGGRLEVAETLLTQTANSLQTTVGKVDNQGGRLSTVEQTANGLQSEVYNSDGTSKITQLATGVQSLVTNLNELEVGGRNLIKNSDKPVELLDKGILSYKSESYVRGPSVALPNGNVGSVLEFGSSESNAGWLRFRPFKFETGQEYTFSFWARRSTAGASLKLGIGINSEGNSSINSKEVDVSTTWQRFVFTVKISRDVDVYNFVELRPPSFTWNEYARYYIWRPQLERANVVSDWEEAPEDTQSQISQLANNINLRVTKGDVINQINISDENILIDGKKLLINSDTVINGTAWMDGAVIANASIDGAKIQDATIGSAKIANLDASKISTGTLDGITVRSHFDYAYDGAIRNSGSAVLSSGQLAIAGSFTHSHGSTYLRLNADGLYGENLYTNSNVRSMFSLDGQGLVIQSVNSIARYDYRGMDFGQGSIRYYSSDARIEIGSYNGVSLGAYAGGSYLRRLNVGGGSDGIPPFVDVFATMRMVAALNMNNQELRNASNITGADTILFRNSSNRLLQSSDGQLSLLSPNQLNLGWTDGSSVDNIVSITTNQVSSFRNLNMQGNTVTNQSDLRLKRDILDTDLDSLSAIESWRIVDFNWIDTELNERNGRQLGVIAQDTPELAIYNTEDGIWSINSSKQIMMNSHAIQQLALREQNTNLVANQALQAAESNESKIHKLQQELSKANRRIEELESVM